MELCIMIGIIRITLNPLCLANFSQSENKARHGMIIYSNIAFRFKFSAKNETNVYEDKSFICALLVATNALVANKMRTSNCTLIASR